MALVSLLGFHCLNLENLTDSSSQIMHCQFEAQASMGPWKAGT